MAAPHGDRMLPPQDVDGRNDSSSSVEHVQVTAPKSEAPALRQLQTVTAAKTDPKNTRVPTLRYRWRRNVCLVLLYVPFILIPWIFTCVLTVRPLGLPSYFNQQGQYSPSTALGMVAADRVIPVMNSIGSILTVPVMSALFAQAAVVYSQRRRPGQHLTLQQTFALADRSWANLIKLWTIWRKESGSRSLFLGLATLVLAISVIHQPLQSALITTETVPVMTCQDNSYYVDTYDGPCASDYAIEQAEVGYDPEPADMISLPQNVVTRDVAHDIASTNVEDALSYLWPDKAPDADLSSQYYTRTTLNGYQQLLSSGRNSGTFFVSALPNGTSTGVLRQHAIRLNSSVTCEQINPKEFPSPCPGPLPFNSSFNQPGNLSVSVCSPGNFTLHPWNISRNRQDIKEDFYLDVKFYHEDVDLMEEELTAFNFTLHCAANTTRGYFELGNYRNAYIPGPLIEQWPGSEEEAEDWNDYFGILDDHPIPSASDPDPEAREISWNPEPDMFTYTEPPTPGPLTTFAISMFGNQSMFRAAENSTSDKASQTVAQICQPGVIPFYRFSELPSRDQQICGFDTFYYPVNNDNLLSILFSTVAPFNSTDFASQAVEAGVFFANRAVLRRTVDSTWRETARRISSSPGTPVPRPVVYPYAIGLISALIGIQIASIAYLMWYIHHVPRWTHSLDAASVAKIAASSGLDAFGPLGPTRPGDVKLLGQKSGLVGIEDDSELKETGEVTLAMGAAGCVTRGHAAPRKRKSKTEKSKTYQPVSQRTAEV